MPEKMALSVEEAARAISLSERAFRAKLARGEIRAVRVGRRVLIPIESLRELLAGEPAAR